MRYVLLSDQAGGWEVRDMWTMRTVGIFSSRRDALPTLRELNERNKA